MADCFRVWVFTVRGTHAHWRKWFTTTSALTYGFPPRTAVVGMVGAILGVRREEVPEVFGADDTRIAVCPLRPIVKDRMPMNWRRGPPRLEGGQLRLNPGGAKGERPSFQANLEVVRGPHYRIVFWHRDADRMRELRDRLEQKRWVYQPYLGILGFLADVEWEGEDEAEAASEEEVEIASVLPLPGDRAAGAVELLGPHASLLCEEAVPNEVLRGRTFKHLDQVYVPGDAQPLRVRRRGEGGPTVFRLRRAQRYVVFLEPTAHLRA